MTLISGSSLKKHRTYPCKELSAGEIIIHKAQPCPHGVSVSAGRQAHWEAVTGQCVSPGLGELIGGHLPGLGRGLWQGRCQMKWHPCWELKGQEQLEFSDLWDLIPKDELSQWGACSQEFETWEWGIWQWQVCEDKRKGEAGATLMAIFQPQFWKSWMRSPWAERRRSKF